MRVTSTRSCSRSTRSARSDRCALASENGNVSLMSQNPDLDQAREQALFPQHRRATYGPSVMELAVSEARDHFADAMEQARRSGEPVYVTRRVGESQ